MLKLTKIKTEGVRYNCYACATTKNLYSIIAMDNHRMTICADCIQSLYDQFKNMQATKRVKQV